MGFGVLDVFFCLLLVAAVFSVLGWLFLWLVSWFWLCLGLLVGCAGFHKLLAGVKQARLLCDFLSIPLYKYNVHDDAGGCFAVCIPIL